LVIGAALTISLFGACGTAVAQRYAQPYFAMPRDTRDLERTLGLAEPEETLTEEPPGSEGTEPDMGPAAMAAGPEAAEAVQLLQKYMVLQQVQRTPSLMLRARAKLAEPKPAENKGPATPGKTAPPAVMPTLPFGLSLPGLRMPGGSGPDAVASPGDEREIQQFGLKVITGDWPGIEKHLATLPKDARPKVYGLLLTALANQRQGIILPDEITALADIAPGDLDDRFLFRLGHMLGQARKLVGDPKDTLARIRAGTKRLGGADPKRRAATARLLLAAEMIEEAQSYLPPLAKAVAAKDPVMLNLHAASLLAVSKRDRNSRAMQQAWDFSQAVLAMPQLDPRVASESRQRIVGLMPEMPEGPVVAWLKTVFAEQPASGMLFLAEAARKAETTFFGQLPRARVEALSAQQRLVRALLSIAAKDRARWSDSLRLTAIGWMSEASYTVDGDQMPLDPTDSSSGNPADPSTAMALAAAVPMPGFPGAGASSSQRRMWRLRSPQGNEVKPLPVKDLLPLCPGEPWCQAVDADTAWQMRRLAGMVAAQAGDKPQAHAAIRQFVDRDPAVARGIAEEYLRAWATRASGRGDEPASEEERQQLLNQQAMLWQGRMGGFPGVYSGMPYPGGASQPRGGIPLARAKQVRNLAALGELLAEFKTMKTPPLNQRELVAAIEACHSPAEIYREEDLRAVVGDLASLAPETTLHLAAMMRLKLGEQWRKPEIQEQMGTQRTDKDLAVEVVRGYEEAMRLVDAAVRKDDKNVELIVLLATLGFDKSEFLYGQKADLKTYIGLRDGAFSAYRRAAAAYAGKLAVTPQEKYSADVYRQWFQSALGASDLAYLTRQDKPDTDEIDRLGAALRGLGAFADRHLQLFGEAITASLAQVPPPLKPNYIRQAARVLGDHPSGRQIRDKAAYYEDLLAEVRLHVAIDGPGTVGHGQPFGVFLSMRYSKALGRESDGFLQLLQKGFSRSTGQEVDYPKLLEQAIGEKLGASFEIHSILFHDPKITPRGCGRSGWQETPLAYAVFKAKSPSVDRIPPVQVDLEFNDGSGAVLLPISSQVVLLDARDPSPPPRPARELAVRQVLDDRRIQSGDVQLEIVTTAKGLVPDIGQLVDLGPGAVAGFRIAKVNDRGLEVKSLQAGGDAIEPVSERRWQIELQPAAEEATSEFTFPKVLDPQWRSVFQRYADTDIVDAAAIIPLRRSLIPRRPWTWVGGAALGLLLAAGAGVLVYRRGVKRRGAKKRLVYRRPEPLTPFSVVALLERVAADPTVKLSVEDRRGLARTIDDLNRRYFGRPFEADSSPDLTAVLDGWLRVANNGSQ
jgi:hypothetical protein